jgi:hypothetical protein
LAIAKGSCLGLATSPIFPFLGRILHGTSYCVPPQARRAVVLHTSARVQCEKNSLCTCDSPAHLISSDTPSGGPSPTSPSRTARIDFSVGRLSSRTTLALLARPFLRVGPSPLDRSDELSGGTCDIAPKGCRSDHRPPTACAGCGVPPWTCVHWRHIR